jgi:hypothetical protein
MGRLACAAREGKGVSEGGFKVHTAPFEAGSAFACEAQGGALGEGCAQNSLKSEPTGDRAAPRKLLGLPNLNEEEFETRTAAVERSAHV